MDSETNGASEPRIASGVTTRRVVLGVAAVAVLILLGWGGSWWTHPTLLRDTSPLGNIKTSPKPVQRATLHAAVAAPPVHGKHSETITFAAAEAHFATNSAHARASFSVCVHRPGASVIGAVDGSLSQYCRQVRPIEAGTKIRWSAGYPPSEYVVVTITPTTPGTARVDAVTFDYTRSWAHLHQHGRDRSVQNWIVRVTP